MCNVAAVFEIVVIVFMKTTCVSIIFHSVTTPPTPALVAPLPLACVDYADHNEYRDDWNDDADDYACGLVASLG